MSKRSNKYTYEDYVRRYLRTAATNEMKSDAMMMTFEQWQEMIKTQRLLGAASGKNLNQLLVNMEKIWMNDEAQRRMYLEYKRKYSELSNSSTLDESEVTFVNTPVPNISTFKRNFTNYKQLLENTYEDIDDLYAMVSPKESRKEESK